MEIGISKKNISRSRLWIIHSLIFLLALMLSTGLMNSLLTYSYASKNIGDVGIKLEYFTQHKDDYDIIFLGPSTTYFGVIPKLFDKSVATQGQSVKSFNFGISAANIAQLDFYLEKILALKPAKLKWIFIDCAFDLFDTHFPTSPQELYWHTPGKTLENLRLILESNQNWKEKSIQLVTNFKSFLYRELGIGQLSTLWQERTLGLYLITTASSENVSSEKLIKESGYYAIEWLPNLEKWKNRFINESLEYYKKELVSEQLITENKPQEFTLTNFQKTYQMETLEKIASRFEGQEDKGTHKIEPIFLIPPTIESKNYWSGIMIAYDLGHISTVFSFKDIPSFRNLYKLNRRIDSLHLNERGAQEYTIAIAEKFYQYISK